jgi:hypothetical protein
MLGFGSFAELPWATSGPDTGVLVSVTKNTLNITIGSVGIIATAIIEDVDPNQVTLGLGTLTITGDASYTLLKNELSLGLGTIVVTAGATVNPTNNALTLATGNVTISGNALVNPGGNALVLDTVEPGIITWNDIIPGATMVWTPIIPY